jgi:uncharacterized protein
MADWLIPVVGGVLMGGAAGSVLLVTGRLPGVSGILAGVLHPDRGETHWRAAFLLGLVTGGALLAAVYPTALPHQTAPLAVMVPAALLVAVGARVSGGCTSGHGLLGMGRLSWRSTVATMVFMAAGMITVTAARHWLGWLQ